MITVDWANDEETVAIWQFRKDWTGQQFYEARDYSFEMISTKNHSVNLIFDFSYSTHSPANIMSLLSALFRKHPSNIDKLVILTKTVYWERLVGAVLSGVAIDNTVHFAYSLEETYELVGLHEE